jgi:hypothetical protein
MAKFIAGDEAAFESDDMGPGSHGCREVRQVPENTFQRVKQLLADVLQIPGGIVGPDFPLNRLFEAAPIEDGDETLAAHLAFLRALISALFCCVSRVSENSCFSRSNSDFHMAYAAAAIDASRARVSVLIAAVSALSCSIKA